MRETHRHCQCDNCSGDDCRDLPDARKEFAKHLIRWRKNNSKDTDIHSMWVKEHEYLESVANGEDK